MTTLSLLHLQYLSPPANLRRILSSPTNCLPPPPAAAGRAIGSGAPPAKPRKLLDDSKIEPRGVMDFIEWSRDLIRSDGGPPRWFSPAECGLSRDVEAPPLLFFLPGIDGVGFGLIRHHQRLGKIFDVWCLHIPVMDRTPFEDLVEYVERTVKSEKSCLPKKPIYLVGESLGACIALAVAARNPDVDFVLVLANPATSFYKSHLESLSAFLDVVPEPLHVTIPYFLSFITGNSMRMSLSNVDDKLSLQQAIAALPANFSQMLPCLTFLADILPKDSLFWKLKMLRVASSFANSRLHAVNAQTLILAGGRDQLLPSREEAERLCKALPNCRIRHFQDSGHNLLLEGGIDLVTAIKACNYYRHSRLKDYVSDYLLPTPHEFQKATEPYRWVDLVASPVMLSTLRNGKVVRGLEGVPSEGPTVFIGYHMLLGLDLGHLVSRLLTDKNIHLRGIAHPFMFERDSEVIMLDPSSFDGMRLVGAVPVSAANFYKLLSRKSAVLLYPGGAREAIHKKGEEYKLFWPERSEFVRMASRFGATIIPFSVVGEDDLLEVVMDINDYKNIPFYNILHERINIEAVSLRKDTTGEIGNQALYLPMMMPKFPGRLYFLFGRPIETKGRRQELRDRDKAQELYLHVKAEVESCISYLKEKREKDPYRNIIPRLAYQVTHGFDAEIPTFDEL